MNICKYITSALYLFSGYNSTPIRKENYLIKIRDIRNTENHKLQNFHTTNFRSEHPLGHLKNPYYLNRHGSTSTITTQPPRCLPDFCPAMAAKQVMEES